MTAAILDGQEAAREIIKTIQEQLQVSTVKPGLAVLLIGKDPASKLYAAKKEKVCREVGINPFLYHIPEEITEGEVVGLINKLNKDNTIQGILVQLPLPPHLNTATVLETINPRKDVDGLTSFNLGRTAQGQEELTPATPKGIIHLLERYNIPLKGKEVTIINHSNIVGKPLAMMFLNRGATVNICHEFTKDLAAYTSKADILVSGTGIPHLIKEEMVKEGAVVIDVGISKKGDKDKKDNQIYGDVDLDKVKEKASWITPVPGGVGPMTVAMLLKNLVDKVIRDKQ